MSGLWWKVWIDGQIVDDSKRVIQNLASIPNWYEGLDQITCPVGKDPGKARFIINSNRFEDIIRTAPVPIRLQTGNTAKPGDEQDFEFKNWIVTGYFDALPSRGSRPLVIDLADPRWIFRNSAYAKQYNVRYPLGSRYEPDTLNAGSAWTWEQIFDDLWNAVPTSGLVTTFEKNNLPGTEPENINVIGEPAWDALCRIAHQQGLEVYYDPFVAKITIDQVTGPMVTVQTERRIANSSDASPTGLDQAYVPNSVRVYFPKRAEAEPGNHIPHSIDAGGGSGSGDAVAWSDLTAETDESGIVISASRLQANADQIANEYTDRRTNNSKSQSIRYLGWDDVKPAPGTTDVQWIAQPFPQTVVSLRPTDVNFRQSDTRQKGTSILVKLTQDLEGMGNDLKPTSIVCDVFGLDTEAVGGAELVAESWSSFSAVQRRIYYSGEATIPASISSPKYLVAEMDYGGNYWVKGVRDFGKIQFTIVSANLAASTAVATVTHRPCGLPVVPGESGGNVTIHDTMGYFDDELAEDLVGRKGTAWYGFATSESCKWLIDGLQCETEDEASV